MSGQYAGDVTSKQAWEMLERDPKAVLLDVRTDAEWRYVGLADLSVLEKRALRVCWQEYPELNFNPNFVKEVANHNLASDQPAADHLPLRRALAPRRRRAHRARLQPLLQRLRWLRRRPRRTAPPRRPGGLEGRRVALAPGVRTAACPTINRPTADRPAANRPKIARPTTHRR